MKGYTVLDYRFVRHHSRVNWNLDGIEIFSIRFGRNNDQNRLTLWIVSCRSAHWWLGQSVLEWTRGHILA